VAEELGQLLSCPVYTSRAGTEQEKAALLAGWLANTSLPALVATSALGVGFDYPWVRWVVHVDAPTELTAFAQESGRAGRGGGRAASIILLSAAWAPDLSPGRALGPDQQAMQLYLAQQHCARGVLSQFLDAEQDWRWCMAGEEPCGVCQQQQPHATPRPQGLIFSQAPPPSPLATAPSPAAPASISTTTPTVPPPAAVAAGQFTGPAEVLRQDYLQSQALGQYEQDLETLALLGSCSYCRVLGRDNSHLPQACPRRFEWIRAKRQTLRACKQSHKAWIQPYIVCWQCYQPQEICRVADPEHEESQCRFPDLVLPLCYGVYKRPGAGPWLQQHFRRSFTTELEYMQWLGETASLRGTRCIQANCVAAAILGELG